MVKNDALIAEAAAWGKEAQGTLKDITTATIAGFVYYNVVSIDRPAGIAFMEAFKTGKTPDNRGLDGDDARWVVRESLRVARTIANGHPNRVEALVRAWNVWRGGRKVANIKATGTLPRFAP